MNDTLCHATGGSAFLVAVRLGVPHVHPAPADAEPARWREAALARRYSETDDPLLPCIDPTQQRYELIRP